MYRTTVSLKIEELRYLAEKMSPRGGRNFKLTPTSKSARNIPATHDPSETFTSSETVVKFIIIKQ